MLSYRHSFHAGNHADVLKHLTLQRTLIYLTQKDKPLCYIDTHAGAGGYVLSSPEAQKNREFQSGIGVLWNADALPAMLIDYRTLIRQFNANGHNRPPPAGAENEALRYYPGSPWLAGNYLRPQDQIWCYELHPQDTQLLRQNMQSEARFKIAQEDGYRGLLSIVPPSQRRGLILVDPPYELKSDYLTTVETITKSYRKFTTGTYLLWYPVVDRNKVNALERAFKASGIRNIQLFELCREADTEGFGMTGSGIIAVNPPWTLMTDMAEILPVLAEMLGHNKQGAFRVLQLVDE